MATLYIACEAVLDSGSDYRKQHRQCTVCHGGEEMRPLSDPATRDAPLLQRSREASTAVHCSSSPHSTLTEAFRSPKKKSGGHDSSN